MIRPAGRLLPAGTLVLCTLIWLGAAPPASQPTDIEADRLVERVIDGEKVTVLVGHVRIDRDSLTVRSDSAAFFRDRGLYEFHGDVHMTRGEAVLTCCRAYYHEDTEDAEFYEQVRLVDADRIATSSEGELRDHGDRLRLIRDARLVTPGYVVWADTITRREAAQSAEAAGTVKIVDPDRESLVTGEHAVFDETTDVAVVDVDPVLTSREQGSQPLRAESRIMTFHRAEERVVMVDSVRIHQGPTVATADTAVIHGQERVVLTGEPELDDGAGSTMNAEEIEFVYVEGELDRVHLRREAWVVDLKPAELAEQYLGLPSRDEMSGDDITVFFEDDEPSRSIVIGNARSVYVPLDAAEEVACNDVTGDTIALAFEERKVRQVDVSGHMAGVYSFMRLEDLDVAAARAAAVLDSLRTALGDTVAPDSLGGRSLTDLLDAAARGESLTALEDTLPALMPADSTLARVLADSTLVAILRRAVSDTLDDGRRTWDFNANREKVEYNGDAAIFDLGGRGIHITGNGRMVYGTLDLTADKVRMDLDSRELYASGNPLLVDSSQKIAGDHLGYGFRHRTGAIRDGATNMDDFFYVGEEIKRFDDGTLKVLSGKMTSCDLAEPHYHFWADKMKIVPGDKVVAKPIVMKVGHVPVFALPFYFKHMESGRRSGILFPSFNFGWSKRTGRYIRDWGYYWATNDYTDFTFQGDYNERKEFTWQISNRYVKRYDFQGSFDYSRRTTLGDNAGTRQWQLHWRHSQPALFDAYKFSADLDMSSKTITRSDLTSDVGAETISGQNTSSMYVSRKWDALSASLSFQRDEYVNRVDADTTTNNLTASQAFPTLKLNFSSTPLLPELRAGQKGSALGNLLRSTYLNHNWSYSGTRKDYETYTNTVQKASGSASLSLRQQRFLFLNLSTGLNASHTWKRTEDDGYLYELDDEDEYESNTLHSIIEERATALSISSSAQTKLYGVFRPGIGRLEALRHTLEMKATHSLTPTILGTQSRSESFGFSLHNRFDVKIRGDAAADSTADSKKLDGVIDWNLSTTYRPDYDADSRWGSISSRVTLKPGSSRYLNVTVNQSFDPYAKRVTSTSFNYGLSLGGRVDTGGRVLELERERNDAIDRLGAAADSTGGVEPEPDPFVTEETAAPEDEFPGFERFGSQGPTDDKDETEGGRYIPWRLGSNFSYRDNAVSNTTTARVSLNLSATLTRNWAFKYSTSYNIQEGSLTSQSWELTRDLHCWSLRFKRTVSSVDSQFGFILSLKAIPDVKITRGKEDMVSGYSSLSNGYL